jgi:hypothetical protein
MTIHLGSLQWAARLAGVPFPEADEDALWRCARAWYSVADHLRRLPAVAQEIGDGVAGAMQGTAAARFAEVWSEMEAPDGVLHRLADTCDAIGGACERAAEQVEQAKLVILAELAALASVAAGFGVAVPGFALAGGLIVAQAIATARLVARAEIVRLARALGHPIVLPHDLDDRLVRLAGPLGAGGRPDQPPPGGAPDAWPGPVRSLGPGPDRAPSARDILDETTRQLLARRRRRDTDGWAETVLAGSDVDSRPSGEPRPPARPPVPAAPVPSGPLPEAPVPAPSPPPSPSAPPAADPSPPSPASGAQPRPRGEVPASGGPGPAPSAPGVTPSVPRPGPAVPPGAPTAGSPPSASPPATGSPAAGSPPVGPPPAGFPSGGAPTAASPSGGSPPGGPPAAAVGAPNGPTSASPSTPVGASPSAPVGLPPGAPSAAPSAGGPAAASGSGLGAQPAGPAVAVVGLAGLASPSATARAAGASSRPPTARGEDRADRDDREEPNGRAERDGGDPARLVRDDEALPLARACLFATDAGYGFYPPGDANRARARAVTPVDGWVAIDLLGDSGGFTINNGRLTPLQFAGVLRELIGSGEITVRDRERVWLVTGGAGDGVTPPAAILACQLGIDVVAPDGSVFRAADPDRPEHERLVGQVDVGASGQIGMVTGEVDDGPHELPLLRRSGP